MFPQCSFAEQQPLMYLISGCVVVEEPGAGHQAGRLDGSQHRHRHRRSHRRSNQPGRVSSLCRAVSFVFHRDPGLLSVSARQSSFVACSIDLEEKEEQGFLAGLKIPAPWSTGKSIESIHPVRDNYKFKETVHIPGARCLYLRFDPRCSSQYDYDKVGKAFNQGLSVQVLFGDRSFSKAIVRVANFFRSL